MAVVCLLTVSLVVSWGPSGAGAAERASRPVHMTTAGPRVNVALPPGLDDTEHSALVKAGAFGSDPVHLLIVGDSIALTLGMGLSEGAQTNYGVTITNNATLGCDLDPQLDIEYQGQFSSGVQGCSEWRGLWPFLVARLRPQVVALGLGRWEVTDHLYRGHWVHIGEARWDAHVTSDMEQAIAILHSFGARVVLFTMPYVDPTLHAASGTPYDEDSPARARAFNTLLRQIAHREPNVVTVVDLNHMLAPGGVYAPSLDGIEVRSSDGIHISPAGGALLQREILPVIARLGLEAQKSVEAAPGQSDKDTAAGARTHR